MNRKKFITFDEALKPNRPTAFSAMIKPAGSVCNLGCRYCYYLDKASLYENRQSIMDDELLETTIKQYIQANDIPQIMFVWHGGEPLIAGLDFYKKAVDLQRQYANGKQIENVLQTNGMLIDEAWCRFFAEHRFLIGISIDGPASVHDAYRRNKAGEATFDKVMNAIELMKKYRVEFNTMSVVSRASEGKAVEIYRFLKSIGSSFMQFLPALEHVRISDKTGKPLIVPPGTPDSVMAEWSVSAKGYGRFLNDIFDEWVLTDVGRYFVQMFDVALAQWVGVPPALCAFADTCGDALVIEHNGDVYSCDHFVYPEYRLGNIKDHNLRSLYRKKEQFRFGMDKRNTLPSECLNCRYYFACRGECPKHRFEQSADGKPNKNALCEGFKLFFKHVDPYMKYMADLLREQKPPALVMPWARRRMGFGRI